MSVLSQYLSDPLLYSLYTKIRKAGAVRSIALDITKDCNLRCTGCYYFEEGMDKLVKATTRERQEAFEQLIRQEKERGTNFVTIVGGEPSLELERLKTLYDNFKINVATNGIQKIPVRGFENMPIGVAVWGDHETDAQLRNKGKRDLFSIALKNYRNDERAFFYYTVSPDKSHEIESVVKQCTENGNRVLFNYFSDPEDPRERDAIRSSFRGVGEEIDRMIGLYPSQILTTSYFNSVVTSGKLYGQHWGYDVCTNLSTNFPGNSERLANGNPYNRHFRAYNADFATTRRCCTGIDRTCESCMDTWEHFSWIMIGMRNHLGSKEEFQGWLSTTYLFYYINRLLEPEDDPILPRLHNLAAVSNGLPTHP